MSKGKNEAQMAQEKLTSIEQMFKKLEQDLSQGITPHGKYETLAEAIKDYHFGLKNNEGELCRQACGRAYQIFQMTKYLGNSQMKDIVKKVMRDIAEKYFLNPNPGNSQPIPDLLF